MKKEIVEMLLERFVNKAEEHPELNHFMPLTYNGREYNAASAESGAARFSARLHSSAWREWPTQSPVCGGNDGIPNRLDRLEALGNAVVPQIPYVLGCFIKQIETELSK